MFAVTMNSKANALSALIIPANFVELKGQVYKRIDTIKTELGMPGGSGTSWLGVVACSNTLYCVVTCSHIVGDAISTKPMSLAQC